MNRELATMLGEETSKGRKALGLTQEVVAEQLNISVEYYGRIERGAVIPGAPTLRRLADMLRLNANMLLELGVKNPDLSS